jgi:hypothetical protein
MRQPGSSKSIGVSRRSLRLDLLPDGLVVFQGCAAGPALGLRDRRVVGSQRSRCRRSAGAQRKHRATPVRSAARRQVAGRKGESHSAAKSRTISTSRRWSRATNRRRRARLLTSG